MSSHVPPAKPTGATRPMTVTRFAARKRKGGKLTMLTAYDFQTARLLDDAGIDAILVGDSLGMVVQGKSSTLPVTLDEIIYHAEIVCRAVQRALVIVDMPFLTFQTGPESAVANAGRILKETGASAVKLEGGDTQAGTIRALTQAGIPVMAHVGMRPQSHHIYGGMGRIQRDAKQLMADAKAAQDAGAFAMVLELIPQALAEALTAELSIPTIGIAAGPHCDGQVLVTNDMLGMTEGFQPRFLKRYADVGDVIRRAAQAYIEDVQTGGYPDAAHSHD
ncbi:MAG: 3-methyl-2-oxobutanoate hydroxymethyltransferase [Planctomycetaceae bacterium]